MAIREIDTDLITRTVKRLCLEATTVLNPDVLEAFEKGRAQETSPQGREIFRQLRAAHDLQKRLNAGNKT